MNARELLLTPISTCAHYLLYLGFALILGVLLWCGPSGTPVLVTQFRVDSLRVTAPADHHVLDSLTKAARDAESTARRATATARVHQDSALKLGHQADSLDAVARQMLDSAAAWRRAYDARTAEATALRRANAQLAFANDSLWSSNADLHLALHGDTLRLRASERLNDDLQRAIQSATSCKIIRIFPCPTRLQTAALVEGGNLIAHAVGR